MNGQEVIDKSLNANLLDFNSEVKELVPLEINTSIVPEAAAEDFNKIRENLYKLNDICVSSLEYLVNNIELIQTLPGIMKQQPTELISEMVKTALAVNDKLIKVNTPVAPKNVTYSPTTINQENKNTEKQLEENTNKLKDIDKMIKEVRNELKK